MAPARIINALRNPAMLAWAAVLIGAVPLIAPFFFTFVFATHGRSEIFNSPPPLWFGAPPSAAGAAAGASLWRNLAMSLYVAS